MSVTWVLNGNSNYEISSKEHLLQVMNEGTLYSNTGSVPTDWRLSSYIQTADIDLLGDSTNIVPIFCGGGYDGNGFTVFNWVYVEPNYPSTPTVDHAAFFDRTYSNAVVKNFRMAGVCSISGFKTQAAFVSGHFLESSSVYNIEVDLSPGSFIQNTNSSSFNTRIGGVCGYISTTGTVMGLTLKGELTITPSTNANQASTMGGIAGDIVNSSSCTLFRNLATFPNPLKGHLAGGITSRIYNSSVTKVLNAMTGDITQPPTGSYIGGIAGLVLQNGVSESNEYVNSMKGNITCNATNSHCAGMFGFLLQDPGATIHSMFNYMTGDITNTFRSDNAAGLVSLGNANTDLTTSINAMNGYVRMPTTNEPSSGAESNIDISFGLTYDIERNITTTPLGLPTDPEVGLPIFDFTATDPDSVVHTFDFVFGNLSITWVLNSNGKHEISSKEHLLQLMHAGSLYADSGDVPADYWDADYEQTVDIDLAGSSSDITPIGDQNDDKFTGTYDGANFSISNWSFHGTATHVGLFGQAQNATLENIRLKGVWVVSNAGTRVGFIVGETFTCTLRNIDCTFDEGTTVASTASVTYLGGIVGNMSSGNTYGLTVKGNIALNHTSALYCGGVVGRSYYTNHTGLRNAAMWPNGIIANVAGGVGGELSGTQSKYCVNSMVGDITGARSGGVIGTSTIFGGNVFSQCLNSMRGTITGSTYAGGIIGESENSYGPLNIVDAMNYMTGSVVGSSNPSGGFVGYAEGFLSSRRTDMSNCINAMNGNVDDVVSGKIITQGATNSAANIISVKIDTSFGLTYTTAHYGSTSDTFTGTTSTLFPELSYVPLVFTDNASNSYDYGMVFGNVGGHASYSQYTHAVVSKGDIAGPHFLNFDPTSGPIGSEFITYFSFDAGAVFTDGSLVVLGSNAPIVYDYTGSTTLFITLVVPVTVSPSVFFMDVEWEAVDGAVFYKVEYTLINSSTVNSSTTSATSTRLYNLAPNSSYTLTLFSSSDGSTYEQVESSGSFSTLENLTANIDVETLRNSEGVFDISNFEGDELDEHMNTLFQTGDQVVRSVNNEQVTTTFVRDGESYPLETGVYSFPFSASSGAGQAASLGTSNITFDETNDAIIVDGDSYTDGDSFTISGKIVTVYNI